MKEKNVPMRRCVGCMESKPKRDLIRLTAAGNGVSPDLSGKANGRGVYLCGNAECFLKARKRKSVSRGLGVELTAEQWERLLGELEEVFDIEH